MSRRLSLSSAGRPARPGLCGRVPYFGALMLGMLTCGILSCDGLHADPTTQYTTTQVDGRVVWFGEALAEGLGVQTVPEARRRELALRTDQGELIPLIENLRARAFRKDERLRQMHVRLSVRKYRRTPALQIVRVYEIAPDGQLLQVDYWCDVCAIVMFEEGPCACCQEPNRLRKRPVEPTPDEVGR